MKKFWLVPAAALPALAVAASLAVATGAGTPDASASPASADRAAIACGTTRSIGLASFITGAAASLGAQQARWARFYVTRYNARNKRKKLRLIV